jgi:hypothetical protein
MSRGRKYFKNEFIIEGDTVKILLPDGTFALIDENQLKYVKDYNWYHYQNKYNNFGVIAIKGRQCIRLHNLIAPFPKVKHINGDKRDCRKQNLQKLDYAQLKVNHRKDNLGKSRFISIKKRLNQFIIRRRFTDSKGHKRQVGWHFIFHGKNCKYSSREEAWDAAQEVFSVVSKWDRYDLEREYDKRKENTGKVCDAILQWTAWEDGELSRKNFLDITCHEKNKPGSFRIS